MVNIQQTQILEIDLEGMLANIPTFSDMQEFFAYCSKHVSPKSAHFEEHDVVVTLCDHNNHWGDTGGDNCAVFKQNTVRIYKGDPQVPTGKMQLLWAHAYSTWSGLGAVIKIDPNYSINGLKNIQLSLGVSLFEGFLQYFATLFGVSDFVGMINLNQDAYKISQLNLSTPGYWRGSEFNRWTGPYTVSFLGYSDPYNIEPMCVYKSDTPMVVETSFNPVTGYEATLYTRVGNGTSWPIITLDGTFRDCKVPDAAIIEKVVEIQNLIPDMNLDSIYLRA